MCLSAGHHPDLSLVVLHSRDEVVARGVTGALMPRIDPDGILSAVDEQGGGTWIGLHTKTGAFAALSNVRNRAPRLPHELSSRGELVQRVLRGDDAAVESGAFSAFNILMGTARPDGPTGLQYGCSVPDPAGRWRTDVCAVFGAASSRGQTSFCKSNESSGILGEGDWPKSTWFREQMERGLAAPAVASAYGEEAARALLSKLEPALTCICLPEQTQQALTVAIARRLATDVSSCTADEEQRLMKGPCVELFSLGGEPYSTVSQTVRNFAALWSFCNYSLTRTLLLTRPETQKRCILLH